MPFFEQVHQDKNCRARCGIIHTDHGDIETPIFMPVGTQASVKTLDSTDLNTIGAQIILGNNYHLHLRPGEDLIAEMGGLHKFMNWNKPILTDSGGFQVFSLGLQKIKKDLNNDHSQLVKIDEDGVEFRSHIDGSKHRFTPESAIECEHKIGADIIMAFDECTPDDAPYAYAEEAMERTHRWAKRSLEQHQRLSKAVIPAKAGIQSVDVDSCFRRNDNTKHENNDANSSYKRFLFGIIQGANHQDLRKASAKYITSLDFDGIAIGGESVGYNMEATKNILDWVKPFLPENKPRYTMGVGLDPADLLKVVEQGIDMFDCVAPTRLARHGVLFVSPPVRGGAGGGGSKHRINIKNATFAKDTSSIDPNCECPTCQNYSRSYLHHLFMAQEISAMRLSSIHNLFFMLDLMRQAREAIKQNRFTELLQKWI